MDASLQVQRARTSSNRFYPMAPFFDYIYNCGTSFMERLRQDPDPNNILVQILKKSKLEGLKDCVKPGISWQERVTRINVVIWSLWYASILFIQIYDHGAKFPTLMSFHHKKIPVQSIPFPAITVCPANIFLKSKVDEAQRVLDEALKDGFGYDDEGSDWNENEAATALFLMDHICEATTTLSDRFTNFKPDSINLRQIPEWVKKNQVVLKDDPNDSVYRDKVIPFLKKSIMNCSEMIVACTWNNERDFDGTCDQLFVPVQTDLGPCCTFNKMPEKHLKKNPSILDLLHENNIRFNEHEDVAWKDWYIDEHFLNMGKQTSTDVPKRQKAAGRKYGISFLLLSDDQEEFMCPNTDGQGFTMHLHSSMDEPEMRDSGFLIPLNQQSVVKIVPDLILEGDGLIGLTAKERGCYFQEDYKLKYYKRYTENNCYRECLVKKMKDKCNCTHIYLPHEEGGQLCGPLDQECALDVERNHFKDGYTAACSECLPPCTEIRYAEKVSYNKFKGLHLFQGLKTPLGKNKTGSVVHAFFEEKSIVAKENVVHHTTSDRVGTIGGILGLTMGLSVIRVTDLVLAVYMGLKALYRAIVKFVKKKLNNRLAPQEETIETEWQDAQDEVTIETEGQDAQDEVTIQIENDDESPIEQTRPTLYQVANNLRVAKHFLSTAHCLNENRAQEDEPRDLDQITFPLDDEDEEIQNQNIPEEEEPFLDTTEEQEEMMSTSNDDLSEDESQVEGSPAALIDVLPIPPQTDTDTDTLRTPEMDPDEMDLNREEHHEREPSDEVVSSEGLFDTTDCAGNEFEVGSAEDGTSMSDSEDDDDDTMVEEYYLDSISGPESSEDEENFFA